jgi:CubicO group peptidase (beta-lactamase class C family)
VNKPDRRTALGVMAAAAAAGLLHGTALAQADVSGDYAGVLDAGAIKLRLRLVISAHRAVLYSLDQGDAAILASRIDIRGDAVSLDFESIGAKFEANRLADGTLAGTFTQGRAMPLRLVRGAAPRDPLVGLLDGAMTASRLAAIRLALGTPAMGVGWRKGRAKPVLMVDGNRAAGSNLPVLSLDKWHLGSITKSFTAMLFAKAVQQGAIGWQTTIDSVFEPLLGAIPEPYSGLTAIELMTHHAGLQPNIAMPDLIAFPRFSSDSRADRLRYIRLVLAQTPAAPRRTHAVYANSGFVVAGAMLEQVMGKPWEVMLREQVLAPLGLSSAGFGPPGSAIALDQPRGHAVGGDSTRTPMWIDNPAVLGPAARLHMSMGDLLTYLSAHRDRPARLLGRAGWDMLHTPQFGSNYAMGWAVQSDGSLWHNGSNTVCYAEALVDRSNGTVAVLTATDPTFMGRPNAVMPMLRRAATGT